MSNKIPTIKRAKWMRKTDRWVATDANGDRASFRAKPTYSSYLESVWWPEDHRHYRVGPRTTPPKDPAKTLRRIR